MSPCFVTTITMETEEPCPAWRFKVLHAACLLSACPATRQSAQDSRRVSSGRRDIKMVSTAVEVVKVDWGSQPLIGGLPVPHNKSMGFKHEKHESARRQLTPKRRQTEVE